MTTMSHAGRFSKLLWMLIGAAGTIVFLEILFQILPVSTATMTGYHVNPNILTYPAHQKFTVATGWNLQNAHRHQANNLGFLAARDFVPDAHAIAVIGDSFVEVSMLDVREQLASQLESKLSATPVYAMGGPGSALLDYAERLRFASEKLAVKKFVLVIENGDILQSLCGSGNSHAPCLRRSDLALQYQRQAEPGLAKRILRRSAFAQYLFSQLKIAPQDWSPSALAKRMGLAGDTVDAPANGSPDTAQSDAASQAVIDAFFARIDGLPIERLVFVLIGQTRVKDPAIIQSIRLLTASATSHGATVVDVVPLIEAEGRRTGLSMHVSPGDGHLNPLALGAIASTVAQEFQ